MLQTAKDRLRAIGINISDETTVPALGGDVESIVRELLIDEGMGKFDYSTRAWTPTSDTVYAFDGEVAQTDIMYTLFLEGVKAIVPGIAITDVVEDTSGMTEEMSGLDDLSSPPTDGTRSISFKCGGNPYSFTLDSYGDWFNPRIIGLMNEVLEKEGFSGQLHIVGEPMDQIMILTYGTQKWADSITELMPKTDFIY